MVVHEKRKEKIMNLGELCEDCKKYDGISVATVYDAPQAGFTCPRCDRVYSPVMPLNHLHYASEAGVRRRMEADKRRERMSVSTSAVVERILKGRV